MRTLRTTRQVARARVIARETAHIRAVASHAESAAARTEARLLAEVERLTAENEEMKAAALAAVSLGECEYSDYAYHAGSGCETCAALRRLHAAIGSAP